MRNVAKNSSYGPAACSDIRSIIANVQYILLCNSIALDQIKEITFYHLMKVAIFLPTVELWSGSDRGFRDK